MPPEIIQFEEFELDKGRYELRRRGRPVKLEKVPMEVLMLLAEREGQLVTREEIIRRVWGDNVYVDTRQGINTAVRKIRLALRDDADRPRILQTVVGKGYRLAVPPALRNAPPGADPVSAPATLQPAPGAGNPNSHAQPPRAARPSPLSFSAARGYLLLIQCGYLIFYAASFVWFSAIQRMRLPGAARLFRQMFPGVLVLDAVWAASPLLLFPKLGYVTLLLVAALAFLPFTQRTLMEWLAAARPGARQNAG